VDEPFLFPAEAERERERERENPASRVRAGASGHGLAANTTILAGWRVELSDMVWGETENSAMEGNINGEWMEVEETLSVVQSQYK